MSRTLMTLALLLLAATAQGMSTVRQGANGSGGSCPQAQAEAAGADPVAAASRVANGEGEALPATEATGAPAPVKPAAARSRAGARWHSFLPGMFK